VTDRIIVLAVFISALILLAWLLRPVLNG